MFKNEMNLVIKIHPGCIYLCYRSGFDFYTHFPLKLILKIIPIFRILPMTKKNSTICSSLFFLTVFLILEIYLVR